MQIKCKKNEKYIDVGSTDIWQSVVSTITINLKSNIKDIPLVLEFIKNEECPYFKAIETARQFNLVRDLLSQFKVDKIVYDAVNLNKKAPWINSISPVITSCANFFTTVDGEDLFYEIIKLLCYSASIKADVFIEK